MRIAANPARWALPALIALSTVSISRADTIVFNDLGAPPNQYDSGGLTVSGASSPVGFLIESADSFTSGATVTLTQLLLGMTWFSGTNAVTVELLTDSSGPDAVLESWNVTGLPGASSCCIVQDLLGNGTVVLNSGATYWVAVLPGDSTTSADFGDNTTGAITDVAQLAPALTGPGWNNQGIQTASAFEVEGTPPTASAVPEPSSILLFGTGVLGLAFASRKRLQTRNLPPSMPQKPAVKGPKYQDDSRVRCQTWPDVVFEEQHVDRNNNRCHQECINGNSGVLSHR